MSVLLSSGSPSAVPPSISVSLSESPTLSPAPASVEKADRGNSEIVRMNPNNKTEKVFKKRN